MGPQKTTKTLLVYIVDEDEAVRGAFARLLRAAGLQSCTYGSQEDFLADVCNAPDACILLDITVPKAGDLGVQARLREQGITLPVIVLSARDDDDVRARAGQLGARMFLCKPVDDQALLDAIRWVISSQSVSLASPMHHGTFTL